jgi:hypothetical protein
MGIVILEEPFRATKNLAEVRAPSLVLPPGSYLALTPSNYTPGV